MTRVAGVDFGTASVRVAIVDSQRGRISSGIAEYPVLRDPADPDHATQRHADHLAAMERAFAVALNEPGVTGSDIAALAVDTTGSTVTFLDEKLRPIDDHYLWCDHRSWREAAEITAAARAAGLKAIDYSGGTYSSEWGFAKLLHWRRHRPDLAGRFATAAEHCDLITATLCGIDDPAAMPRSICAMGHKWMWSAEHGGLPSQDFLGAVDPLLEGVRERLAGRYDTSAAVAGHLSPEWAARLGLKEGIPVPVGALDAHWDAIGAGCRLGDVINVLGTSSCIMALANDVHPIPGVNGVVPGSIHPNLVGIEAGLAAVGDLFDAIARRGATTVGRLASKIADYRPLQTGLLRLCWDNGDRSVRADPLLAGVTIGQRLHHGTADELFAAIEGTGFHTRIILERLADHDVCVERVINAGGIPQRNDLLNRTFASILGKPVLVPATDSTGLGAAIFAFVAAGTFATIEEAQHTLCPDYRIFVPDSDAVSRYEEVFGAFRELYFSEVFQRTFMLGREAAG